MEQMQQKRNHMSLSIKLLIILSMATLSLSGCSSLGKKIKGLLGGSSDDDEARKVASFKNTANMGAKADRQYKRVTKDNFSDAQGIEANAGSLWRREGQAGFLFAQNNLRNLGDIVNVKIEERTAQDLSIKAEVIKSQQTAIPFRKLVRKLSPVGAIPAPEGDQSQQQAQNNQQNNNNPNGQPNNNPNGQPGVDQNGIAQGGIIKKEEIKFDVHEVPTRITERFSDGSFRVKGMQTFMIGRKEYKVLVTGVVKPEDIDMDTVSSTKVLEGKFDLVATSKTSAISALANSILKESSQ